MWKVFEFKKKSGIVQIRKSSEQFFSPVFLVIDDSTPLISLWTNERKVNKVKGGVFTLGDLF